MQGSISTSIDDIMYESRNKKNVRIHRHTDRQSRLDRSRLEEYCTPFLVGDGADSHIALSVPEVSHCSLNSSTRTDASVASQFWGFFVGDGAGMTCHVRPPRLSHCSPNPRRTDTLGCLSVLGFFVGDGADRRYDLVRPSRLSHCSSNPRRTDTLGCLSVLGIFRWRWRGHAPCPVPRGFQHIVLSALEN